MAIVPSVPRTDSGASGLGSNESMCVTPPAIQSTITDSAVALPAAGASAEADEPGKAPAARPIEPTRSTSRRPRSPDHDAQAFPSDACLGSDRSIGVPPFRNLWTSGT